MIPEKSNRDIKSRPTLKVGDLAFIYGASNTSFWKTLIYKPWYEFVMLCIKQYLKFSKAIMAILHWCVFRFRPGYQTMGIISTIVSISFLLSYNSTLVPVYLKPFAWVIVPLLPFFKTPDELYHLAVNEVESQFLLIYSGLYVFLVIIHLITIWTGNGNPSISKRGESWIGFFLSKLMPVDEFVICGLIEPLLGIGLGLAAWKFAGDTHFAVFMVIISLAEATQQILDKAYQAHTDSILRA